MHAMPPNFGAGGGQAIEVRCRPKACQSILTHACRSQDAYILGRLLADPRMSPRHVSAVLRLYERVRLSFALDISRRARDVGLMYEFNAPGYFYDSPRDELIEREKLDGLGEAIRCMWEWQWTEKFDDQWEVAKQGLEDIM